MPVQKFGYVGTTGRVVFPWFSPDLHAIDEELHERVQQSIGSRIRRELDSVLRDREDQLYCECKLYRICSIV